MAERGNATLSRYFKEADQHEVLDRQTEHDLALAWQKHQDRKAADRLIRAHLRYVVAIALKYRHYGVPLSELVAEGNFGLMHALKKFEPERGYRFVTYAAYWIRAYVLNYVIRSWSMVGGGSGALRSKVFFRLRRERVRLMNLIGDTDKAEALLANRLKVTPQQLQTMLQRLEARDVSLDAKVFEDALSTLGDNMAAPGPNQEETFGRSELRGLITNKVRSAVEGLDKRERYIVEHRLLADPEDELSLAEIGRKLGVSRERARQLEARAKGKLRDELGEVFHREVAAEAWSEPSRRCA